MPTSAFIVPVHAAEPLVADLRARHDASAALGVPAHITVLYPFMRPELLTPAVRATAERAIAQVPAFDAVLDRAERFPTTAYLAPASAAPFVALTQALVQAFPDYPPYGGEHAGVVPHLTAANGSAADAEAAFEVLAARLAAQGPVQARCDHVLLMDNASGRWVARWRFPLA